MTRDYPRNYENIGRYFCRNSITIDTRKNDLAAFLASHIAATVDPLFDGLPECNLYVSGSLGRGEPCFNLSGSRPALCSDVDFVAVGFADRPPLAPLEARLSELFPEIRDTLYFLPAESIGKLFSASAVDMTKGMARPIFERFTLPVPPVPAIGIAEMLEVVIYQVAGLLSSTGAGQEVCGIHFWQLAPEYQALKAMVDLMRALAVWAGGDATMASAFALRREPIFAKIFKGATVEIAAEVRESWQGYSPFDLDHTSSCLRRLLRALLPSHAPDLAALVDSYRAALYCERNILHVFPVAVLIEGLLPSASERDARLLRAMRRSVYDDLRFLGLAPAQLGAHDRLSGNPDLKSAYISEMIRRKDRGGAIWHWRPAGGDQRCERRPAYTH
jgi:hypothetical protein